MQLLDAVMQMARRGGGCLGGITDALPYRTASTGDTVSIPYRPATVWSLP